MASATTENGEVETKTPLDVTGCTREDASLHMEKDRSDEGYQGPHDWRKILRPIEDGNLKSLSARLINIFERTNYNALYKYYNFCVHGQ